MPSLVFSSLAPLPWRVESVLGLRSRHSAYFSVRKSCNVTPFSFETFHYLIIRVFFLHPASVQSVDFLDPFDANVHFRDVEVSELSPYAEIASYRRDRQLRIRIFDMLLDGALIDKFTTGSLLLMLIKRCSNTRVNGRASLW